MCSYTNLRAELVSKKPGFFDTDLVGGPRLRKIQISEIFNFGDFEAKLIDFVKEFSKETAPCQN